MDQCKLPDSAAAAAAILPPSPCHSYILPTSCSSNHRRDLAALRLQVRQHLSIELEAHHGFLGVACCGPRGCRCGRSGRGGELEFDQRARLVEVVNMAGFCGNVWRVNTVSQRDRARGRDLLLASKRAKACCAQGAGSAGADGSLPTRHEKRFSLLPQKLLRLLTLSSSARHVGARLCSCGASHDQGCRT